MRRFAPNLVEVLRLTLQKLQASVDLDSRDPAMQRLKGRILRDLAELEVRRAELHPSRVISISRNVRHVRGSSERWEDEQNPAA